jgi:CBS domain-containing protein
VDIAGFLQRHAPFDTLSPEQLQEVARSVEIEHVPAGSVVLRQGGEPASHLYVVRKGAMELVDDERAIDLLGEGEIFGQFSLLAGAGPTITVRAHEDTLCYLIPASTADEILDTSAGRAFVIDTMRRRIRAATGHAHADGPDLRLAPVSTLIRREPVSVEGSLTVADAAALMASEHVSSLLIRMRGAWGIVTDRDLRSRVVAERRSLDTPLEDVATFPAKTLAGDTSAAEALLRMLAGGVHHFPVTSPDGGVIGMVTDTDLMGLTRHTPFAMKAGIDRAGSPDALAQVARDMPDVVVAMVDARADPIDVGRVIALTIDSMTTRLLELAMAEQGDAPCPWAWLALGSAARHEQALKTDQDHALAYDPKGAAPEDVDPYFARLAESVTAGLEAAGIPRCEGNAMAVHPDLRKPIGDWVNMFVRWMDASDPHSSTLASIGYDYRQVTGSLEAEPALDAALRRARERPQFLRQLGRRALDLKPPTGFFGNVVVEHAGDHVGRLDIKHGGITIVTNLARAYAMQTGVTAKGTPARLEAASSAGGLDASIAQELGEAFHYLWDIRLRHQAAQVRAGAPVDNFIDPATLGPFARSGLKESFHVIARAQRTMATELGVSPR